MTDTRKTGEARTTIGVKQSTKTRLDGNRAPGQCYDGFLCQLVDVWEESKGTNLAKKLAKKDS